MFNLKTKLLSVKPQPRTTKMYVVGFQHLLTLVNSMPPPSHIQLFLQACLYFYPVNAAQLLHSTPRSPPPQLFLQACLPFNSVNTANVLQSLPHPPHPEQFCQVCPPLYPISTDNLLHSKLAYKRYYLTIPST